MTENTKIEWADHTFNPWIGCTKVSPACDHCYAERVAQRMQVPWGPGQSRKRTRPAYWQQPLRWNSRAEQEGVRYRVFCASLADVFDNEVPQEWREDLWALIEATPNLDWLLLTKRIGNVLPMIPMYWRGDLPPNVWIGATIVNQLEANRDIPKLLEIPAAVRFLSCEPLLGPLDITHIRIGDNQWFPMQHLHWVIAGGESGPRARPSHPDWFRSLRDHCQAAEVAFHFKQWGEWFPGETDCIPDGTGWVAYPDDDHDPTAIDWEFGPVRSQLVDGAEMLRLGKKRAGRMLDGRTWDEVPA